MKKTIIFSLIFGLILTGCSLKKGEKTLTMEEAKTKVADFINKNLVEAGNEVTVAEVTEEDGLYKLKINMKNGQEIFSYISKNGKNFYPQAMQIEEVENQANAGANNGDNSNTQPAATTVSKKSDKPVVEAFVMSYCPYGTQIEKGIIPVAETLGNKIDFKIKFVSYTMHGQKENDENLLQYCIDKEQPTKFFSYLKCFLKDSAKSAECLKSSGVDTKKTDSCITSTKKQFNVEGTNFDVQKADNEKYGVKGSPTLVINGEEIQSARDSASLLKTICSAFNTTPKECDTQLSSAPPAPGFGEGTTSGSSDASCQ